MFARKIRRSLPPLLTGALLTRRMPYISAGGSRPPGLQYAVARTRDYRKR